MTDSDDEDDARTVELAQTSERPWFLETGVEVLMRALEWFCQCSTEPACGAAAGAVVRAGRWQGAALSNSQHQSVWCGVLVIHCVAVQVHEQPKALAESSLALHLLHQPLTHCRRAEGCGVWISCNN